jgi:hypothetical protein
MEDLRCSFCHKSQDVVAKLISSPPAYPRVYICDECVRVCNTILADDSVGPADFYVDAAFVGALRRWLAGPPEGPAALKELQMHAEKIFGKVSFDDPLPKDPGVS